MAKIIRVDGCEEEVSPANGTDFQLEELHKIVGGYIEIVRLSDPDLIMIVDEEGKVKNKDINGKATDIYGNHTKGIVGDVLVCRREEVK